MRNPIKGMLLAAIFLSGCCGTLKAAIKEYGAAVEDNASAVQAAIDLCEGGDKRACARAKQSAQVIGTSAGKLKALE
jgi:hypothetical protein